MAEKHSGGQHVSNSKENNDEMQNITQISRWGEVETTTMLAIMKEQNIVQQLDSKKKLSIVFGHVSQEMKKRQFTRTADQIRTRYVI